MSAGRGRFFCSGVMFKHEVGMIAGVEESGGGGGGGER